MLAHMQALQQRPVIREPSAELEPEPPEGVSSPIHLGGLNVLAGVGDEEALTPLQRVESRVVGSLVEVDPGPLTDGQASLGGPEQMVDDLLGGGLVGKAEPFEE